MLILYAASKYDYGKPEQGLSFEHYNFFECLRNMGHDILYFDFPTLAKQGGSAAMSRRLVEVAQAERPALLFTVLYEDEFEPAAIRAISEAGSTLTANWFTDDHWRFDTYSSRWAPLFNWSITTASSALPKYERIGCANVIKSQWACNPYLYRKLNMPPQHDVTFVGQPHGNRPQIIQALREAGIAVQTWGTGWGSGRLTQDAMIRVFNTSRINLNLSNASTPNPTGWQYAVRRFVAQALNASAAGRRLKAAAKRLLFRVRGRARPLSHSADQIKGRNFEVPGCGGFLLTGYADNLEQYYEIGKEVACFENMRDLIDQTRYYLRHEAERAALAEAGYRRTQAQHTYVHRFTEIFERMGLPCEPAAHILARPEPRPGNVVEITYGRSHTD